MGRGESGWVESCCFGNLPDWVEVVGLVRWKVLHVECCFSVWPVEMAFWCLM